MSPLDAIYADRVLTSLYDFLNPPGADTDFYLSLPKPGSAILDIGCGTGLLAAAFAKNGHDVVGLDPAPAMLDIARQRPGGERVCWVGADARDFDLARSFDLVVMTGHVFQVFLEDRDIAQLLGGIRRHLKPDGRLAFESRNPAARAWEYWTPDHSRRTIHHPTLGIVETWHELEEVGRERVSFSSFASVPGFSAPLVSHSVLAFRSRARIGALLDADGFATRQWLGNWDGMAFEAGSPEMIVVAA